MPTLRSKPHITLNTHKHVLAKYRCNWGRYNGYANSPEEAYHSFTVCLKNSKKYIEADCKRNLKLKEFYEKLFL